MGVLGVDSGTMGCNSLFLYYINLVSDSATKCHIIDMARCDTISTIYITNHLSMIVS